MKRRMWGGVRPAGPIGVLYVLVTVPEDREARTLWLTSSCPREVRAVWPTYISLSLRVVGLSGEPGGIRRRLTSGCSGAAAAHAGPRAGCPPGRAGDTRGPPAVHAGPREQRKSLAAPRGRNRQSDRTGSGRPCDGHGVGGHWAQRRQVPEPRQRPAWAPDQPQPGPHCRGRPGPTCPCRPSVGAREAPPGPQDQWSSAPAGCRAGPGPRPAGYAPGGRPTRSGSGRPAATAGPGAR